MITGTLSTSISLCAARTAASGLVSLSSTTRRIGLPSRPPAWLISSATACIAFSMRGPSKLPAPVSGVSTPRSVVPACARGNRRHGERRRRQRRAYGGESDGSCKVPLMVVRPDARRGRSAGSPDRRAAPRPHHRGCCGRRQGSSRDARSPAPGGILLHHGDGDALAVDLADRGEQLLRGDRRQPAEGSSSNSSTRLHHQRHRHRQHLALAARQRARGAMALLGQHREAGERRVDAGGGVRAGSMQPPISRFSRTESVGKTLASCGTKATPRRAISRGEQRVDRRVAQMDRAARRMQQAGDGLQQRGFAGAVGADDGDDLAAVHGERHAFQDFVAAPIAGDDVARGRGIGATSPASRERSPRSGG